MTRPRLLDLYCGCGGASVGYWRAGWHPEGIDIKNQRYYPFRFGRADALDVLRNRRYLSRFDAIHASPPCQEHSTLASQSTADNGWMLAATLELLDRVRVPWVVENVETSPLPVAPTLDGNYGVMLCGSMFDLGIPGAQLRRHRLFQTSFPIAQPQCRHVGNAVGVYGGGGGRDNNATPGERGGYMGTTAECAEAMGIDWAARRSTAQAVPPAYAEYIGRELLHAAALV